MSWSVSSYNDGKQFFVTLESKDGREDQRVDMHCHTAEQQRAAYRLLAALVGEANLRRSTAAHARRLVDSLATILEEP